ncbi:hypothetical protein [Aurantimonas endophytica]|nr:hypothetical protein [Aurantimonas endophytica]
MSTTTSRSISWQRALPLVPQEQLPMDGTIYFLHIPKSGGISATRYFEEAAPSEAVCPHKLWDELVSSGPDPRWRVYHGHFGGLLPVWLRAWPTTVSLLRDPTSRTFSHIKHVLRTPSHPFHEMAQGLSVAQYCAHPILSRSVENYQARYLSSLALSRELVAQESSAYAAVQLAFENSMYGQDSAADLLETSCKALEALAAVGVTEKHQTSLRLFSKVTGLPEPKADFLANVAPAGQQTSLNLTADDYAAVQSVTEIDRKLYERGLERFARQCLEHGVAEILPDIEGSRTS